MDGLADWIGKACARLDIDAGSTGTDEIVELAGDVRRTADRATALMAVYLLGVAVGRGADPEVAAAQLADLTRERSGTTCDWRD
jgi:hypothetical protein